ncbi:MAG: hypothetical protein ABFS43_19565 [Thermodesulfobacteriota bacterium]
MNKNTLVYICIITLMVLGMAVLLSIHVKPQVFFFHSRIAPLQPASVFPGVDQDPGYPFAVHLIAGICALLLVGYLFWSFYLKSKKEIQADLSAMEGSLFNLSLATGRTEYELFCKSAEGWSVSGDRIDEDFKRYMVDQVLPYYTRDFVRKNHEHLDETLIKKVDVGPPFWWDWAKALLVFPGSLLLLVSFVLIVGMKTIH